MSDTTANSARPVSLVTVIFLFVLFGLFFFAVQHYYRPAATAPQSAAAENLPKELAWKATPASRRDALTQLKEKQAKQAASYAWVNKDAGVVQLPISRAMELTVERYSAK